ncbi:MAG: phage major capsid protein [Alphaproteobacteria bacterium]|nr:phage major capsid protein [Alphaproteobacteria bacterium]
MDTLETKVAASAAADYGDVLTAFEAFKEANDERLAQIEKRQSADTVTTEKVDRINKALDEMILKSRRPQLAASPAGEPSEHKKAFETYVRKGDAFALNAMEAKAMSVGSGQDGGYLVPPETEAEIGRLISKASPFRDICDVRQISAMVHNKPFNTNGHQAGWIGEATARPQTTSATLAQLSYQTMELYAMPAATQALLDDSVVNIDDWMAREVQTVVGEQETSAFTNGDGITAPKGLLTYPKVAQGSWTWGNTGYIATGVAGGWAATAPSDKLLDLVYSVKAGYRTGGRFMMSRNTQSQIRKFKDNQNQYLWQPAQAADQAPTLMGFPVTENEYMPDIATGIFGVAFGNFHRGYLIVDRIGVRVLRDPYTAKPYVLFYVTKRVGGGMQDFDAIKLLKFDVS